MLIKLEYHSRQSSLLNLTRVAQAKESDSLILASSTEVFGRQTVATNASSCRSCVVKLLGIITSLLAISTLFVSHCLIIQGAEHCPGYAIPLAKSKSAMRTRIQNSKEY